MITYDTASNSILVANASPSQLAEVEQLIEEFDQAGSARFGRTRRTAAIKMTYSKPSVIAATIKEVYRDLLSSKDKEFDSGRDQQDQRGSAERITVISYGGDSSGSNDRAIALKVGFDGALSSGPMTFREFLSSRRRKALRPYGQDGQGARPGSRAETRFACIA